MVTGIKLGLGTGVVVVGVSLDEGLGLAAVVRVDSCLGDSGVTLEVATTVGGGVEFESGGVGGFGYDVLTELEVAALEASTLEAAVMEAAVLEATVLEATVLEAAALEAALLEATVLEADALEAATLEVSRGLELGVETKVEDITDGDLVVAVRVEVGVVVEAEVD